ncbi:hydantoinase/oxoprolinase family protein [Leucobacter sp. CSA1]|uniref:Hydantoinase/oxoprolinase family protein n=1 Tax=Leucobacter chromiisoli TaxID=2796471 RepID=A0A934Q963_9MICO|nr:hydantoinase/oxoprolinase family protein [Leucobacter chromiisoli]MBK0419803.1 hydantoinase/oxoprolinase family protein [Leucobacter chromiisoli]
MAYRVSVDTGGTFTDVVVADDHGALHIGKALTTYRRAYEGIEQALTQIAAELDLGVGELLAQSSHFAYGTTRSTNAIVEGKTARTAFFTTEGFPDTLLLREGGRLGGAFSPREFTPPYVPRYLTFEIAGRIDSDGDVFAALDERSAIEAIAAAKEQGVESIGVSLLWSTVNPSHELRVAELIEEHFPEATYTLSHQLNPIVREYRRASSTVIDASLKPLMQRFLGELASDLQEAGFAGKLLLSTSFGGSWPLARMIERPIYSVGSGPSMAPIAAFEAGRTSLGDERPDLIVCDTGGTTFDVGLVSAGEIHYSVDTWLGEKWTGHITGTKSVDVRSIGAGGGSIVSVDDGGLVHVGPESAGADPGPACYGRGGTLPTVTDAALILGYFDPEGFIGGKLALDLDAARSAMAPVADRLGISIEQAAKGALVIATQNIVSAIREMTISQGLDPRDLTIVAGGGASGVNAVQIARELGVGRVVLPRTAGALSAAGALNADVISDFAASCFTQASAFDYAGVREALADLDAQGDAFVAETATLDPLAVRRQYSVDARYPGQVWELEVAVEGDGVGDEAALQRLEQAFHAEHLRVFQVNDPSQRPEFLVWKQRVTAVLDHPREPVLESGTAGASPVRTRTVGFALEEVEETPIYRGDDLVPGTELSGPGIILEPTTTLVLDPGAELVVARSGDYIISVGVNATASELVGAKEAQR